MDIGPAQKFAERPPRVVATTGVHGSASTWVFNVARELMAGAIGGESMAIGYADQLDQLPPGAREGKPTVLKSHMGGEELDAWLAAERARVIVSLRDPRDAALSMTQRFEAPLGHAVRWIDDDCRRALRMMAAGHPVLRYEDRFFERRDAVDQIATWIGQAPAPDTADAIFARYKTEAVRAFAASLAGRPPDQVAMVDKFRMDPTTQILSSHVGDGRSGKWRELPPDIRDALTARLAFVLGPLGYST